MPRSLLNILLEKKDKTDLPYPSETSFNLELENLESFCLSLLTELKGIESSGGLKLEEDFKSARDDLKKNLEKIEKYKTEWKDNPWNDPSVQKSVREIREEIQKIYSELNEIRKNSLGDEDSFRIGNSYYEKAEALRIKATKKIFEVASLRDKEIKVDRQRSNTDITEQNEVNAELMDIVAKQEGEVKDETEDQKKKRLERNEKRKKENAKLKQGMFHYLASILGETPEEVKTKWGGEAPTDENKKYRKEIMVKAMPFVEMVTGKDYNENNPFGDKNYMKDVMVISSYSPGYTNAKASPEEEEGGEKQLTEEEKKAIGEKTNEIKKEIKAQMEKIKERHKGESIIDKKIKEEIEKSEKDLDSVDSKTACDISSRRKLKAAKSDLQSKIKEYKSLLKEDDLRDLVSISGEINKVLDYCAKGQFS